MIHKHIIFVLYWSHVNHYFKSIRFNCLTVQKGLKQAILPFFLYLRHQNVSGIFSDLWIPQVSKSNIMFSCLHTRHNLILKLSFLYIESSRTLPKHRWVIYLWHLFEKKPLLDNSNSLLEQCYDSKRQIHIKAYYYQTWTYMNKLWRWTTYFVCTSCSSTWKFYSETLNV